jgi:hypothetical protein
MLIDATQVVSLVTGICGAVLGSAALAISVMTYFRDNPKLKVLLQWDMTETQSRRLMGLVKVTNVGRRPVYLGIVALEIDPETKCKYGHLVLNDSISGARLGEGDKPAAFIVNYDQMVQYKEHWSKIRAMAEDSTGKAYYSDYPKSMPSWAR